MNFAPYGFSLIFITATAAAQSDDIKKVFIDEKNNVQIVDASGIHRQITRSGNARSLKIAPNNTVAWLVMNNWIADGDTQPQSEELKIYSNGKIRSIKCSMFIRDHWFWKNGNQIAIDCGGRHFAGWEYLYDTKTLRVIESFDQADIPSEKRPAWSSGE